MVALRHEVILCGCPLPPSLLLDAGVRGCVATTARLLRSPLLPPRRAAVRGWGEKGLVDLEKESRRVCGGCVSSPRCGGRRRGGAGGAFAEMDLEGRCLSRSPRSFILEKFVLRSSE